MLVWSILIFGILSRAVIHIPNFTPVVAIALFSGVYMNKKYAVAAPVILMIVSDIIIGFHETFVFTWGAVALISLLGFLYREKKNLSNIISASLMSSVIFFIISNIGVWLVSNLYPLTVKGLLDCFYLAIPFFGSTLVSTVIYSVLFFSLVRMYSLQSDKAAVK